MNPQNKNRPALRVMETLFIHDRERGEPIHDHPRPDSVPASHDPAPVMHVHPQAARGRPALENESAETRSFERIEPLFPPLLHFRGAVDPGLDGDQAGILGIAFEAHRFPRNTQPALDLRAYGHTFDRPPKLIAEESVELVTAVVAGFIPEEAGADTDFHRYVQGSVSVVATDSIIYSRRPIRSLSYWIFHPDDNILHPSGIRYLSLKRLPLWD
jgi:hypothetical protein